VPPNDKTSAKEKLIRVQIHFQRADQKDELGAER
jgi:hypothetical protein